MHFDPFLVIVHQICQSNGKKKNCGYMIFLFKFFYGVHHCFCSSDIAESFFLFFSFFFFFFLIKNKFKLYVYLGFFFNEVVGTCILLFLAYFLSFLFSRLAQHPHFFYSLISCFSLFLSLTRSFFFFNLSLWGMEEAKPGYNQKLFLITREECLALTLLTSPAQPHRFLPL